MVAGLATITQLTPDMYQHLEQIGGDIRKGLKKLCSDLRIKAEVVGISSIFHLHFTDEPVVDAASGRRTNKLLYRYFELSMLNKGISMGKRHPSFCSTPITDSEVKRFLKAAEDTLGEMKPIIRSLAPTLIGD